MEYREAKSKDLNSIIDLNLQLFKYESQFSKLYDLNWPKSERGKNYFAERITNGIVFVCEDNSKIVGYICGNVDNYSYRSPSSIAEIENMFVLENFRAKGIGSELFSLFQEEAKARSAERLKVGAIFNNDIAISFYKKMGFKELELFLDKDIDG